MERTVTVQFKPTPEELAHEFWSMGSDEQAEFFNQLGRIASHVIPMQLQWVTDSADLTDEGRSAMAYIGEYAPVESKSKAQ